MVGSGSGIKHPGSATLPEGNGYSAGKCHLMDADSNRQDKIKMRKKILRTVTISDLNMKTLLK
jgi:hypothetical protein